MEQELSLQKIVSNREQVFLMALNPSKEIEQMNINSIRPLLANIKTIAYKTTIMTSLNCGSQTYMHFENTKSPSEVL